MTILLEIPDHIVSALGLPEADLRDRLMVELGCGLYATDVLAAGKAAELAGRSRAAFGKELAQRGIARHFTEEDLAAESAYAGVK